MLPLLVFTAAPPLHGFVTRNYKAGTDELRTYAKMKLHMWQVLLKYIENMIRNMLFAVKKFAGEQHFEKAKAATPTSA